MRISVVLILGLALGCGAPVVELRDDAALAAHLQRVVGPRLEQLAQRPVSRHATRSPDGRWAFVEGIRQSRFVRIADGREVPLPLPEGARRLARYSPRGGWVLAHALEKDGPGETVAWRFDPGGEGRLTLLERRRIAEAPVRSWAARDFMAARSGARDRAGRFREGRLLRVSDAGVERIAVAGEDAHAIGQIRLVLGDDLLVRHTGKARTDPGLALARFDVKTGQGARLRNLATIPAAPARAAVSGSPDGRWLAVLDSGSRSGKQPPVPSVLWRVREGGLALEKARALPAGIGGDAVVFSADSRWLAVGEPGLGVAVYDLHAGAEVVGRVFDEATRRPWAIAADPPVLTLVSGRQLRHFPVPGETMVEARVDGDLVRWQRRPPPHQAHRSPWAALRIRRVFRRGAPGSPAVLTVRLDNQGVGAAYEVSASLRGEPALPRGLPARLHFGTIPAGGHVERTIRFPTPATLDGGIVRFTLSLEGQGHFAPPPDRWLSLPNAFPTPAAYDALARAVHDHAVAALRRACGRPTKKPVLQRMGPRDFGFTYGRGVARYQDLYGMSERSLAVNHDVMQVDTREELVRHGQMMLLWYVPHELVHAAEGGDGDSSWHRELHANLIQPYLTAELLTRIDGLPYTADTMAWVYDRYVDVLGPHLSPDERARVDAFIAGGPPPFDQGPFTIFRRRTAAYVYFIARANQQSWRRKTSLKALAAKHLMPSTP